MATDDTSGESASPQAEVHQPSPYVHALRKAGAVEGAVNVQIGPRFLELFSENLYSSPNKAFEELVSNSWDAGASVVHVSIPASLTEPGSAIWVLDNGESMDLAGLEQLWAVASAAKRDRMDPPRPQIGKFGIGKLATYILANEITYICRAADGITRAVTMDYLDIDERAESDDPSKRLQIGSLPLEVRRYSDEEARGLLAALPDGEHVLRLVDDGIPLPEGATEVDDGFGGEPEDAPSTPVGTWTLAILTNLKDKGTRIQAHQVRRMLRAALPLGASISIGVNGEAVESTKLDIPIHEQWVLGPGLTIDDLDVDAGDEDESVPVVECDDPYRHVTVEGIPGVITGTVRLYAQRISGGKSEDRARSVGFFVNVRGRVIALDDPYFGLENLSHGAWAHFRCTVRADGLDAVLNVERDTLRDGPELRRFRALLRALFNKARSAYPSLVSAAWPNAGELLARRWDAFPLHDLSEMITERLGTQVALPDFVDVSDIGDAHAYREQWLLASKRPSELLTEVRDEEAGPDDSMAMYQLNSRKLIVNANHPFVREHSATAEEKELVRDLALVDFLVATRMVQQGIEVGAVEEAHQYRDQVMRMLARLRRRTGAQIAQLLLEATGHARGLEVIVGEALDYLGFVVTPMGGRGEPEGIAQAAITPRADDSPGTYSLTYEAKSTTQSSGRVSADDVNPGRLKRHREKHAANHTLVVGPDFAEGVLTEECTKYLVTPMRAADLATLLIRSGRRGIIPLTKLREMFELHDPDAVHMWVEQLSIDRQSPDTLTLEELLEAIERLGFEGPDTIQTSTLAYEIRRTRESTDRPTRAEVQSVAQGFSVLLPGLLEVQKDDIYISGSVAVIRQRISEMLDRLPEPLQTQFAE
ncbi:MAG: ATP-binding protein [Chloroflexi bacterium]|nr:ATP-binding protein [Chloroflexota bacterium]